MRTYNSDLIAKFLETNKPVECGDGASGIFSSRCIICQGIFRPKNPNSLKNFGKSSGFVYGVFLASDVCYLCRKRLLQMKKAEALEEYYKNAEKEKNATNNS